MTDLKEDPNPGTIFAGTKRSILFFVLLGLPVFCALFGHRFLFSEIEDPQKIEAESRLEEALNQIDSNKNPTEYYSRFFQRLERRVFRTPDPLKVWKDVVPVLRKRFGQDIDLLFLDGSGKPAPGYCDRPVPAYLSKKFVESYQTSLTNGQPLPDLVQSFMKNFFGPSCIVEREGHGYLNYVSPPPDPRLAYFSRPGPTGMFIVFLKAGPSFREGALNDQIARFNWVRGRLLGLTLALGRAGERVRAVGKRLGLRQRAKVAFWTALKKSPEGKVWFEDSLITRRNLFPSLWLTGRISVVSLPAESNHKFFQTVACGLFLAGTAMFLLPEIPIFVNWLLGSVRIKLLLAFLYAVMIPLLIMGMTARKFLAERRQVLEEERHQQVEKAILEFDNLFSLQWRETMVKVQQHFVTIENPTDNSFQEFLDRFEWFRAKYQFDFCQIHDLFGTKVFNYQGPDQPLSFGMEDKMIPKLVRTLGTLFGVETETPGRPLSASESQALPKADAFLSQFGAQLGLFGNIQAHFGKLDLYSTSLPLGRENRRLTHLAVLSWSRKKLEQVYLRGKLPAYMHKLNVGDFFAWAPGEPGLAFPAPFRFAELVRPHLGKVVSRNRSWRGKISDPDQDLLLTGLLGTSMRDFAFLVVTNDREIRREIHALSWKFGFVTLCLLGFGFIAVSLLGRLFIRPIGDLTQGLEAISRRDFSTVIPVSGGDELGALAQRFNETLVDLQELEVARAVQESLFPSEPLLMDRWEIFGSCQPASQLGGDYFDYFQLDEHRAIIIIGDVAGHGVGAALVMAMAKAIIGHPGTTGAPEDILACLNSTLFPILKKKKMMSCCLAILDETNGMLAIGNAGQCFPIMCGNEPPSFLELKGFPLGIVKSWKAAVQTYGPLSTEMVVFYSDGLVEAVDSSGAPVGYERFMAILPGLRRESAKATEQAIRAWHSHLSRVRPPEDDISIVVLQARQAGLIGTSL